MPVQAGRRWAVVGYIWQMVTDIWLYRTQTTHTETSCSGRGHTCTHPLCGCWKKLTSCGTSTTAVR